MLFQFKIKYIVPAAVFWLAGLLFAFLLLKGFALTSTLHTNKKISLQVVSIFHPRNVFLFILLNNCLVALLLSVAGFFTGGLLTIIFNIWNGIFFGLLLQVTMYYMPQKLWTPLLYGPFEMLAFFLFSAFGFEGTAYIKNIFLNIPVSLSINMLNIKRLWLPAVLLCTAAVIEALTIKYL